MDDVKNENVQSETVETTAEESTAPEQTTESSESEAPKTPETQAATQEAAERMVPLSVVKEERKKRQELQRKIAEIEGSQKLNQYDPNDLESVLAHPMVQELMVKQAKQELTDYARETLENYPTLNPAVKKAILANVRGFVKETTQDVESAKLDLQEYIDSIVEEADAQPPTPKSFPVATTNVSKTDISGIKPARIQEILETPVDEWTEEETAIVDKYKNLKK